MPIPQPLPAPAGLVELENLEVPGLAPYTHLTNAQLRRYTDAEQGIFIAESVKVIRVALEAGCRPLSFLMEHRQLRGAGGRLAAQFPGVPVYTGTRALLAQLTGYALTRGVLCAMSRPLKTSLQHVLHGARRLAVLEGVVDATNIGAIFRSAAALGVDGVLLAQNCCDPLARRSVRVSMGTVFQIPWAMLDAGDWPGPVLRRLHAEGFCTVALALSGSKIPIDDARLCAAPKLAVVLGAEGDGLAQRTIADCTYTAYIPMAHGVDSLNVAAASAVAFWQLRTR